MKISASINEFAKLELYIYKCPKHIIGQLIAEPNCSYQLKMTRKFISKEEGTYKNESIAEYLNLRRHQLVLNASALPYSLPGWSTSNNKMETQEKALLNIKIYSQKLTAEEIKDLGLEPIPKAVAEEEKAKMLYKLGKE